MTEILSETVGTPRLTTLLLGSLAALALTLAAIGIYPYVYLAVAAGSLVVASLACAIPAHRATRLDPVRALRGE